MNPEEVILIRSVCAGWLVVSALVNLRIILSLRILARNRERRVACCEKDSRSTTPRSSAWRAPEFMLAWNEIKQADA
jgi:hypothetical protein